MKTLISIYLLLAVLACLGAPPAVAPLVYDNPNELIEIGGFAGYYVDKSDKINYLNIREVPDADFRHIHGRMINFGFSEHPVWIRFRIKNNTGKLLYTYLEAQEVDYVDILVVGKDTTYHWETGVLRAYGKRQFNVNSIVIPLGKNPEFLYISIKDINRLVFPIKLGTIGPLVDKIYHESLINAFVAGLLLVIALLSFSIYAIFGDSTFLLYAIHVAFSILTMLVFEGYLFEMFWRDMPYLNNSINSNLVRLFTFLSSMAFSIHFLHLKSGKPIVVKIYTVLAIAASLTVPARVAGFEQAEKWFNLIVIVTFISYLVAGTIKYRQGFRPARFYLLGWGIYIFEIILLMLTSFDVLSFDHFYTYYGYQIGAVFLAFFLALSLSDRIDTLISEANDSRRLAQKYAEDNKQLFEEHNRLLEQRLIETGKPDNAELSELLRSMRAEREKAPRIAIATVEGIILCDVHDVLRIEAQGSYSYIYLQNRDKILASKNLSSFERQLTDFSRFHKIHKSSIINLQCVVRYNRGDGGTVVLNDGTELAVSRNAKPELLRKLGLDIP